MSLYISRVRTAIGLPLTVFSYRFLNPRASLRVHSYPQTLLMMSSVESTTPYERTLLPQVPQATTVVGRLMSSAPMAGVKTIPTLPQNESKPPIAQGRIGGFSALLTFSSS